MPNLGPSGLLRDTAVAGSCAAAASQKSVGEWKAGPYKWNHHCVSLDAMSCRWSCQNVRVASTGGYDAPMQEDSTMNATPMPTVFSGASWCCRLARHSSNSRRPSATDCAGTKPVESSRGVLLPYWAYRSPVLVPAPVLFPCVKEIQTEKAHPPNAGVAPSHVWLPFSPKAHFGHAEAGRQLPTPSHPPTSQSPTEQLGD